MVHAGSTWCASIPASLSATVKRTSHSRSTFLGKETSIPSFHVISICNYIEKDRSNVRSFVHELTFYRYDNKSGVFHKNDEKMRIALIKKVFERESL